MSKKKRGKKKSRCNICGREFKSEKGLRIHKSMKHKNSPKQVEEGDERDKIKGEGKEKPETLELEDEKEIAEDFATKVYEKFNKLVKSIVLFGSQAKNTAVGSSDIDIVIIVDDASIQWDQELVSWYREELGKLIQANPYQEELHINTIKVTTWWKDLLNGDPVVINILRFGQAMIDFGGFFNPLKVLLERGDIKSTPESIYAALERIPGHLARSQSSEAGSMEGVYWAMVDGAQAALMAADQVPPSPEHIPDLLGEIFVDTDNLKRKYVKMFKDAYSFHKKISHGQINNVRGDRIDKWQENAEKFVREMNRLVDKLTEK